MAATSTSSIGSLQDQRRAAGLTQTELATRADCSVAYVRQLEAGCIPRFSVVLPRILAVLNDSEVEPEPVNA